MSEKIISGSVKYVSLDIQVSASFKKRELVVTTDEQYPQHILINFIQDKTEYLDRLEVGQLVSVSVNIRGREWTNPQGEVKYFNDIQGWKVSKHTDENNNTHAAPPVAVAQNYPQAPADSPFNKLPANTDAANFDDEVDDMPF
tara:strand:- start:469 stop:897 length:429 start_codon:yes stop_codon:yes gene_type:complete